MEKILVILGPTATGKTDLGLYLAKRFNGELVACDSRQVYAGLDIGTGKYPSGMSNVKCQMSNGYWEIDGIKIFLYDVVDPKKQYTVDDYVKDANRAISNILKRNKLPIIVGGTGFYLKALLEGLSNLAVPVDKKLRKELVGLDLAQLQIRLKQFSPKRWEGLNQSDRQNPRRLVRGIELSVSSLRAQRSNLVRVKTHPRLLRRFTPRNDVLKVGLTAPREVLYKRVDDRVISRMNQGMIDEAKMLHKKGLSLKRMRELGLEYGSLADYLNGEIREIEGDRGLIKIIQNQIHGYIKRQLTWFKKEKKVSWFDITTVDYDKKVEKLTLNWYNQQ